MAHPTRTGDLVVFSSPPYQFDAATPGTLIARSAFFGQHGYVPDVKNLRGNTNMRATFLAGGDAIRARRRAQGAQHRPGADGGVPARHPVARAQPGRRAARPDRLRPQVHAGVDRRAERLPRSARPVHDHGHDRRSHDRHRRRVAARDAVRRGGAGAAEARAAALRRATTSAGRRRTRRCSRTGRRSTSRTRGTSTPRPTATTSSTTAFRASSSTWSAPTSRSCRRTSSRSRRAASRRGWTRRRSSGSTACGSG